MQREDRDKSSLLERRPLMRRLEKSPWEFDFFRAVWSLERGLDTGVRVGGRGPVAKEVLRFRPHVIVGFPSTDIRRITRVGTMEDGTPVFRIEVTFLGLYGVASPMPAHYAIQIFRNAELQSGDIPSKADEERGVESPEKSAAAAKASPGATTTAESKGGAARDFLDLLNHRMVSYFYRAWTKYRYEFTFGDSGRDDITRYLLWLIGVSPEGDAALLGVPPIRLLRYAGMLTQHPRSAVSLEGVLTDYWGGRLPIRVDQHVGRWVALPVDDLNRIGLANSRLGEDLTAGEQVYDLSGAFNIEVGPVDWDTYMALLPDGEAHAQTRSLARLFTADPLLFTVEIKLAPGVVPELRLGSGENAGRLGLTSWVRTKDVPATSVSFTEMSCAASRFSAQRAKAPPAKTPHTSHAGGPGAAERIMVTPERNRAMG